MKISTDKRELNVLAHYLLNGKVKVTRITAANGLEVEVRPGALAPTLKLALQPRRTPDRTVVVKITTNETADSAVASWFSQGFRLAVTAFGPDLAAVIANAGGGLFERESQDRIRLNLNWIQRRYHLPFSPVISSLAMGSDRLELKLEAA